MGTYDLYKLLAIIIYIYIIHAQYHTRTYVHIYVQQLHYVHTYIQMLTYNYIVYETHVVLFPLDN